MSKFKVGDKVRCVDVGPNGHYMTKGSHYTINKIEGGWYGFICDRQGQGWCSAPRIELVPEEPKGTFERLMIEALPQGGYKVTAAGAIYAHTHNELAAFSTLPEAVAFVGRNMK